MSQYPVGDEIQRRMLEACGVVDPERTRKTLEAALGALEKQAVALQKVDYEEAAKEVKCRGCGELVRVAASPGEIGRTAAYTAKVVDEIYRLSEFAQGRADSRPDVGVNGLLEFLTNDQFEQVVRWVEAAKAGRVEVKPKGELLQ